MTQKNEKFKAFEKLSFEDAMARLEQLVASMENGSMKLESMIEKFEEAKALSAICQKRLCELKQKVEVLTKDSAEGQEWRQMDTSGIVESQNDFLGQNPEENSTDALDKNYS